VFWDGRFSTARDSGDCTGTAMSALHGCILYSLTVYAKQEGKTAKQLEMICLRRMAAFFQMIGLWQFISRLCHDNCTEATKFLVTLAMISSLDLWHGTKNDEKHFRPLNSKKAAAPTDPVAADCLADLNGMTLENLKKWVRAMRADPERYAIHRNSCC
jgi:hypothetical protein